MRLLKNEGTENGGHDKYLCTDVVTVISLTLSPEQPGTIAHVGGPAGSLLLGYPASNSFYASP